jgi:hypothetical protein
MAARITKYHKTVVRNINTLNAVPSIVYDDLKLAVPFQ